MSFVDIMGVLREIKVPDTRRKKKMDFFTWKKIFFYLKKMRNFYRRRVPGEIQDADTRRKKMFLLKNYAQILQVGPKIPSFCWIL